MQNDPLDRLVEAARASVPADPARIAQIDSLLRDRSGARAATDGMRRRTLLAAMPLAAAFVFAVFIAGVSYGRRAAASGTSTPVATLDATPNGTSNATPNATPNATSGAPTGDVRTPRAAGTTVTFVLVDRDARAVSVVGAFNDWTPDVTRLVRRSGNVWSGEVTLQPGTYSYAFVVDGHTWIADPAAPRAEEEDFGRPSSLVYVNQKAERRHGAI